jgi:uncharacterized membrane protein
MVLDLRPPPKHGFSDLGPLWPKFLVYALSFTFLAIYWNNHHHLMHVVERIDGRVLWANMGLLFFLSLTPAATGWLGPHTRDIAPTAVYGLVQLSAALAYFVLTRARLGLHPPGSSLATAIGNDRKGRLSAVGYLVGVGVAFAEPWLAIVIYVAIAVVWVIPDSRISRVIERPDAGEQTVG